MLSSRVRWAACIPAIVLPSAWLSAAGGPQGLLYVCDSSSDRVVRFTDSNRSGFVEMDVPGEISVFYDDSSPGPDLSTPSHLAAGPHGALLLLDGGTVDAVLVLSDKNGDGDAVDDGEVSTFYDATGGGPKLSTPNTLIAAGDGAFYVSDDGSSGRRIIWIKDIDGDGDALDAGEARVVYDASALSVPVLEDVESIAVSPDGSLLAADSTLQAVFVLRDATGDGDFLDEGELVPFFQSGGDFVLTDIEAMVFEEGVLYACDKSTGKIARLVDANGDGDAGDPGEAAMFLDTGTSPAVGSITDGISAPDRTILVLDNSKDTVFGLGDSNGDGDVVDAGEVFRWLVDDGSTLATPSGLLLVPGVPEPPGPRFVRGDASADGRLDISDPIAILGYLFLGRTLEACPDALDSDDTGGVDISDAVYSLNYLFTGGSAPPAPYPDPGADTTADTLSC